MRSDRHSEPRNPSGSTNPDHNKALRRALLNWFRKNKRDLPWRRTRDPYAILVSEIMLQQTTVVAVIPYFENWLRRFPSIRSLARANESQVLHAWQGLGYYSRARNLHRSAQTCATQFGGTLPATAAQLSSLPGIGRYTANAVTVFAFDHPLPIVEANTARVLVRLFNILDSIDSRCGRKKLWDAATRLVPKSGARHFQSALMDLGALVCVAGKPRCHICPIKNFCTAPHPWLLPIRRRRRAVVSLTESHDFINQRGMILLEKCRSRWRGMWMLPATGPQNGRDPIYSARFPFTYHQITLRVFHAKTRRRKSNELWFPIRRLKETPIPSPHRRAIFSLVPRLRSE